MAKVESVEDVRRASELVFVEGAVEWVQSGTCSETSTTGSMMDLSMISRPEESLGRGSCCADMMLISR